MEGARFAESLAENPIDVLKIVPSHLAALLSSGGGRGVLPGRTLILGGEALSWELVDQVRALGGSCEIVNHYGPTETTVGSLTYRVAPTPERLSKTVPIGRPIANTRVFILDEARQPVPIGVPGELFIGGVGVARGLPQSARGHRSRGSSPIPFPTRQRSAALPHRRPCPVPVGR